MEKIIDYFQKMYDSKKIGHAFLLCNTDLNEQKKVLNSIFSKFFYKKNITFTSESNAFIINPVDNKIKIQDIDNLKKNMISYSQKYDFKIYIINHAELMNDTAANKLLKFLEEPSENIYAFLLTTDIEKILPTIKSRCQIIFTDSTFDDITDEKYLLEKVLSFIISLYKYKNNSFVYLHSLFLNKIEKNDIIILIKIYKKVLFDILSYYYINKTYYYDYNEFISKIMFYIDNNNFELIFKQLEVLNNCDNMLKYNVNTNLFFDKFILEMEEIFNG